MKNYFQEYTAEQMLKVDLDNLDEFPDFVLGRSTIYVDGIPYPTDIDGNILTEQQKKEERLRIKRNYYQRMLELDLIAYTPELQLKMGLGHYRENKGYNKFEEWCCNKCKTYKPRTVEYFPKDKNRKRDGLGYTCRDCLKSYSNKRYQEKKELKNSKTKNEVKEDVF